MSFITIGAGASEIEAGTYTVILTELSDPKTVVANKGPRAGEEVRLVEWTFTVDEGDSEGVEIRDSSAYSERSGPKSKMFAWVAALLGKAPEPGQGFDKGDLVGRRAIASVVLNENGWPKIASLVALPVAKPKAAPAAKPAPVAAGAEMPF